MSLAKAPLALAVIAGFVIDTVGPAYSQDTVECADEKSHQFDFWIGDWEVYAGEDLAGHSSVKPIVDGCVLLESWNGASGSAGSSFNFYNPQKDEWQQFWVWRNGTTLEVEGGYADGRMILEGDSQGQDGGSVRNRITWHDNPDGTVRQHWETSVDAGETWKTAFDGLYRKTQ